MDIPYLVSVVEVRGYFLDPIGNLVPTDHYLNTTAYLSIVADHANPSMTILWSILIATSSRTTCHVTNIRLSQMGFLNLTVSSLYSNSLNRHQSQAKRAPLGCSVTGGLPHGCAADKSKATAWCYHANMDQNLWGMFPAPCWIFATKAMHYW